MCEGDTQSWCYALRYEYSFERSEADTQLHTMFLGSNPRIRRDKMIEAQFISGI